MTPDALLNVSDYEAVARERLSVADHGYVLESGRIVLSGTGQELLADDQVRRVYLGEE